MGSIRIQENHRPAAALRARAMRDRHHGSIMEPTYFAQYRGFEFQCSPERIAAGAFAPRLVIFDSGRSLTFEMPVGVPTAPFTDPTAAAHLAFALGRRWVDAGHFAVGPDADIGADALGGSAPRLLAG
jgi:hypothetical protein